MTHKEGERSEQSGAAGEKCQSENGRKYVSDKEKAAPGILEP